MEKKKKKFRLWHKVLLGIVLVVLIGGSAFRIHMRITPEVHESYNLQVMGEEGRKIPANYSTVYMTTDISSDGLLSAYDALGVTPTGNVAVKLSTGEAGGNNYLSPKLIKKLVQKVDGTIVECNTAYGGSRSSTAMHMQVAKDHGFTDIADVDIMDADGYKVIPVENGTHITENWVGKNLENYDFVMVLSHFKGHAMGGFGGALKNISIGIASREGKARIHTGGESTNFLLSLITNQNVFLESMAEAAKSVSDYENKGEKMIYISVMNRLSVDCDCDSSPAEPDMHDIGILASTDPVALDQACVDLVYEAKDGKSLEKRMERQNGIHILTYAEKIGLGNRAYKLIDINETKGDDDE